jgi:hypothetical protein
METQKLYAPLRWLSYVVLALMGVALVYAGYISIAYWPGIRV